MAPVIESGTSLSHYKILGPLGAGGMGEVYKAYDTKLERTVAVKILPPQLVRNEERLRRFIQEARAASSLNHPHIVTVHEIGESTIGDGDASQHVNYIAMELIEGVTLRRKIHAGGSDLRVNLSYLAQAAEGVAKAHAAGIVHRDLKPENVMVSADGFAKVLDFGLAKLTPVRDTRSGPADSTAVWNETREGVVMGTVAYMSPEQVQGKSVDHRSDIFSFGAILYEATTGQRPFDADSDIDLMHRILHEKPTPVGDLNPSVPAELRRVIRRCLAKDPDRRYQSMKDLAIELREIVDEYEELSASTSSGGSASTAPAPVLSAAGAPSRLIVLGALAITAAAIVVAAWFWAHRDHSAQQSAPFASMTMQRLTSTGRAGEAAISPDGRYVASINRLDGGLHNVTVRHVATGSDVEIVPPGDATTGISFSPDGNYVYYSRSEARKQGPRFYWLYQVPVLGGPSRQVMHDVDTAVSFSPDGRQLAFGRGRPQERENAYVIANLDGTEERVIATFPAFLEPSPARWSPDGSFLAVSERLPPVGAYASPILIDIATGKLTTLEETGWWDLSDVAWLPGGRELLVSGLRSGATVSQIWRQPLDGSEPSRVTNDFNEYQNISLTGDGQTLLAEYEEWSGTLSLASPEDPGGGAQVEAAGGRQLWHVDTSASGSVVVQISGDDGTNVGLVNSDTGELRRITNDGLSFMPSISGDGRSIAFVTETDSKLQIFMMTAEGSGRRRLTSVSQSAIFPHLSPDGRTLVYEADSQIWKVPTSGGNPVRLGERPLFSKLAISPDSRRIAGQYYKQTPEGIAGVLRIQPLNGGMQQTEVPFASSRHLGWMPSGDAISFVRFTDGADNIFEQKLDGSEPRQLTRYTEGLINSYDWLPDGRLAIIRGEERSDVVLITNFLGQQSAP